MFLCSFSASVFSFFFFLFLLLFFMLFFLFLLLLSRLLFYSYSSLALPIITLPSPFLPFFYPYKLVIPVPLLYTLPPSLLPSVLVPCFHYQLLLFFSSTLVFFSPPHLILYSTGIEEERRLTAQYVQVPSISLSFLNGSGVPFVDWCAGREGECSTFSVCSVVPV